MIQPATLLLIPLALTTASDGDFLDPLPLAELNTDCRDKGPCLSGDGRRLYFTSDRPRCKSEQPFANIWCAERESVEDPFGEPKLVLSNGGDPAVSSDELTIYFVRLAEGPCGANLNLFVATRPSRDVAFGEATPATGVNSPFNEVGPCLSGDGLSLCFASDRPGGLGKYDLWVSHRDCKAVAFHGATNVTELNSPYEEANPALTGDGLAIYFASDRPGTLGRCDLYRATRPVADRPFGSPENLVRLNSPRNDKAPTVTADGSILVFRSNRQGGSGLSDLYVSRRAQAASPCRLEIQALRTPLLDDHSVASIPWTIRVYVEPDSSWDPEPPRGESFLVDLALLRSEQGVDVVEGCSEPFAFGAAKSFEPKVPLEDFLEIRPRWVTSTDETGSPTPDPRHPWFRKIRFDLPSDVADRIAREPEGSSTLLALVVKRIVRSGDGSSGSSAGEQRSGWVLARPGKDPGLHAHKVPRPFAATSVRRDGRVPQIASAAVLVSGTGFAESDRVTVVFRPDRLGGAYEVPATVVNEFLMTCPIPPAVAGLPGFFSITVHSSRNADSAGDAVLRFTNP